jgi:hypothetical protein
MAIAAPFTMSAAKMDKVDVCHNGKTLSVNGNAAAAHQGHGDTLGACPTDDGGGDA